MIVYTVQWEDTEYKTIRVDVDKDADQADVIEKVREAAEKVRPGIGIRKIVHYATSFIVWSDDLPRPKPKPAAEPKVEFDPGKIVMTPGAMEALKRARQKPSEFLVRHIKLEQGELNSADYRSNRSALNCGLRLLSHYKTTKGDDIWLVTEFVDVRSGADPRKRETTTLLLPSEY